MSLQRARKPAQGPAPIPQRPVSDRTPQARLVWESPHLRPEQVLQLQRTVGNRATHRLIQRLMTSQEVTDIGGKPFKGLYSKTYKKILKKIDNYHADRRANKLDMDSKAERLKEIETMAANFARKKITENKDTSSDRLEAMKALLEGLGVEIRGENTPQTVMAEDDASTKLLDTIEHNLGWAKRFSKKERYYQSQLVYARQTWRYIHKWFDRYGRQTTPQGLKVLTMRNETEALYKQALARKAKKALPPKPGDFNPRQNFVVIENRDDLFLPPRLDVGDQRANSPALPKVSEVKQGNLGDCYFLAALIVLIEKEPQFIKNMMTVTRPVQTGPAQFGGGLVPTAPAEVSVRFFEQTGPEAFNAKAVDVTTDKSAIGVDVATYNSPPWIYVVEKAYAKFKGSFEAIEGGNSVEAFMDLMGPAAVEPGIKSEVLDDEVSYEAVKQRFNRGYYVTMGTRDSPGGDQDKVEISDGTEISLQHAYAVMGIDDQEQAILLRNPHGKDHRIKQQDLQHFVTINYVKRG